jgi:hypothetical protein
MSNEEENSGKGRPTPKRKDAEAGRKSGFGAPRDAKAARVREREARMQARAGLMAGDSRYFPARDRGPVREYVRDSIDTRRTAGEFFIPGAIVVMVGSLFPGKLIQTIVFSIWATLFVLVVLDTVIIGIRLRIRLRKMFPNDSSVKGAAAYGSLRALQMRRFRIPPPRIGAGGKPIKAKAKKSAK